MSLKEEALIFHRKTKGKISVESKSVIENVHDLSLAYSPGVAEPVKEIAFDPEMAYYYTSKWNMVAVVTDGSAILGLGNLGALASLPVMEGKAVLFKKFGGVDAFPICLNTKDSEKIIETVKLIEPVFGGVNLEDIGAPRCFEIERALRDELSIPVFHDDQHGTAVVTLAGLHNALKIVGKKLEDVKIVINGAGAAGISIAKLLVHMNAKNVILCDTKGTIYRDRGQGMNPYKEEIAQFTNPEMIKGTLADAMKGADVFIGVSVRDVVNQKMVKSMAKDPIVFACANPDPEIHPNAAKEAGAAVVATGRSDFPNQINNVLGFPGLFRGVLDVRARVINDDMNVAAAVAIADSVEENNLTPEHIVPSPLDLEIYPRVAAAVARAAMKSGVARFAVLPIDVELNARKLLGLG
ncbi:Malate dehydrogenase (oxaloacetate-decarboxylating) (NADP(+)) [Thermodesulfobium narugense DSM 14796]|uniref:Malate dehydrogenase (Oxaloacetate-decarboxylating) (NADP(+)) n=1 Tax=Thermodesulfobium narugense DSM 14796 TaxID=747365 RepID=M1E5V0_9BACT|nr:malic enzyme-like NAD(P)-binding protein [Thermodesulfobium narugense]AEE13838.1 Malate dehydrogenase (oxaloacetate-decarboxylating) (NADP(+)) [Thermodesulfobium narugense DSM 14796]